MDAIVLNLEVVIPTKIMAPTNGIWRAAGILLEDSVSVQKWGSQPTSSGLTDPERLGTTALEGKIRSRLCSYSMVC